MFGSKVTKLYQVFLVNDVFLFPFHYQRVIQILSSYLRKTRNYGQKKGQHLAKGLNSRLDEVQAALLAVKLPYLEQWNARRRVLASLYSTLLKGTAITPLQRPGALHVYHLYVVRLKKRDKLKDYLKKHKIDTLIHYPIPIHLQRAYRFLGYKRGNFPNAERYAEELLSLPLNPFMQEAQVRAVCNRIKEFYGN